MSRYRRATIGNAFFFTVVSYRRRAIFCHEPVRRALREAIELVRAARPFKIDGWVLMPDHMHCIWTLPDGDVNYPLRWAEIKRFVSTSLRDEFRDDRFLSKSRRRHRESMIWQRRFWEHAIRNEVDMERHLDYIHFNPVKHGYAQRVIDWPFSTFGKYVRAGIYPEDWGGSTAASDMDLE
jgi:putative transposase